MSMTMAQIAQRGKKFGVGNITPFPADWWTCLDPSSSLRWGNPRRTFPEAVAILERYAYSIVDEPGCTSYVLPHLLHVHRRYFKSSKGKAESVTAFVWRDTEQIQIMDDAGHELLFRDTWEPDPLADLKMQPRLL